MTSPVCSGNPPLHPGISIPLHPITAQSQYHNGKIAAEPLQIYVTDMPEYYCNISTENFQDALVTHVRASLELGGVWRVLVTHSCTAEIETRLRKVSRPMSSDFSW